MNHRATRTTAIAAAFGLATALAAAPALAQEDAYPQQAQPAQPTEVSELRLIQFVDALEQVSAIREEAAAELEGTTDRDEAQRLQEEAQYRMIEAVQASGLSVEEYNHIATLMGTDPELQERVHSKLEERG